MKDRSREHDLSAARVLIVGAGIGGLTAALALRRRGVHVEVVERAPEFRPVGAGITLGPNAVAVLDALGVRFESDEGRPMGRAAMLDERGRTLTSADPVDASVPFPALNVRRHDLHEALLRALRSAETLDGPAPPVQLGTSVESVASDGNGATVRFDDGHEGRWDLVIGADGVRSRVRASIYDARRCATRPSGQLAWRFLLEDVAGLAPDGSQEFWAAGRRLGLVPLTRDGIYVYLAESDDLGGWAEEPWFESLPRLRRALDTVDPRAAAVLRRAAETPDLPVHLAPLDDLPEVLFGRGRVLLLGDAAHAMTPNLGQGAAMAIEDAGCLALYWGTPLDELVATLEAERRRRVEQVHLRSWRLGRMAHWRSGLARRIRNGFLRAVPASLAERGVRDLWRPGIDLGLRIREQVPDV